MLRASAVYIHGHTHSKPNCNFNRFSFVNGKQSLSLNIGVEKLQAECKQALANCENDFMARFRVKSKKWTDYCKENNM
jgi:hypothetical protein